MRVDNKCVSPIIRVSYRCVCAIIGASLCASASVCDLLIERETETETQIQSEINREKARESELVRRRRGLRMWFCRLASHRKTDKERQTKRNREKAGAGEGAGVGVLPVKASYIRRLRPHTLIGSGT